MKLKSQCGLSSLGWLVVLAVAGFALMCAFKLIPAYADNRYVQEALLSLSENSDKPLAEMSTNSIKAQLEKFYMINNVRHEGARNIVVERTRTGVLVNVNYEVRIPLVYNIDVVLSFKNQLDSANPQLCCTPPKDYRPAKK